MVPLKITAEIETPISIQQYLPLDGLLMAIRAKEMRLPPPEIEQHFDIQIPVLRNERGFYHASFGRGIEIKGGADQSWRRRRFPLREAALIATDKVGKIPVNMGPQKSVNIPLYTRIIPKIEWWCVGDLQGVSDLLAHCLSLGRERNHGFGSVASWNVVEVEDDYSLFYPSNDPTVAIPSRTLPRDLPELAGKIFDIGYFCLQPPYFQVHRQEMCAVPPEIGR